MIEIPKVYFVAFMIAWAIHLFFMQKYETYMASYWMMEEAGSGPGHIEVKVSGGEPNLNDFLETILGDLPDGSKVVVLGWQKTGVGWYWKPIWKH